MSSALDRSPKQYEAFGSSNGVVGGDGLERIGTNNAKGEAKKRAILVEWLNNTLPGLSLPLNASDEELRMCLIDGTILCRILNRLRIGSEGDLNHSSDPSENIKRFLAAMDDLVIPRFKVSDLEKGYMKTVIDCLVTLRARFIPNVVGDGFSPTSLIAKSGSPHGDAFSQGYFSPLSGEERQKIVTDSKFQRPLRTPVISEQPTALRHPVGHKFHEVFQLKQGRYADLPEAKISEMMKPNCLDYLLLQNAPTQSLLSVVNGILDESIERKNGEISNRVACLLRKVVQEIERRISTQAEHLRTQNNLFKVREEKYQSRIRVLEALASGTNDESQIVMDQLQHVKPERVKIEEREKSEGEDAIKLMKEKDHNNLEISTMKQELEITKKACELRCMQMETEAKSTQRDFEKKLKELEHLLENSRNNAKELESNSETKSQRWNQKEHIYQSVMEFQFGALQELRFSSTSIKQEILKAQNSYSEEFDRLGVKLKVLADAAENYDVVLAENRKMFNEIQDLKGNIRVYCRIRPFFPGQREKRTTVEYIGENGELVVANRSKPGKEGHRLFKFNKIFGPDSTQAEVFSDVQPLIRSVLDGYNVCIFAYGQTGSGKTYTMTGPNSATKENWGVNYRALNDLFDISQRRRSSIIYEMGVQMVEIYNEQVRDLLSNDGSQKKLGILSHSQPNGLAVPDASMQPVKSTSDVMDLMDMGLRNRAVGATALNERSSRSHSVLTIHVVGRDVKTGAPLHGNLNLVDLAGSERVDRSEVIGDRLKEAQHINKSLSALGDVIFALAQKNPHVPYRNSKLTQVLQSSLGGQAKTLMFVQLNPDVNSYSESLSTLKFAERVSGVELGAARSSKEGRDVRELMEQVASLKDTIGKKDEEIERLQLLKDLKSVYPGVNGEKHGTVSLRHGSSSPGRESLGGTLLRNQKSVGGKGLGLTEKAASGHENHSVHSDKPSEPDSQQSMDDSKYQNLRDIGQNSPADAEISGYGDHADYEERMSDDLSDGGLSVGAETDGSAENASFSQGTKPLDNLEKSKSVSKVPRAAQKTGRTASPTASVSKDSSKVSPTFKTTGSSSSSVRPPKRWV
ncbi:kinesin-like protein KIN-14K isoform X2 [Juglans microcarpa x Juglans regia]|uniref:kinesin-like protein KIN-14K isoform X2 n=1 Tax=Juglans microcarpa x Juglans regia TaxID=2249226 RepID=UPI001B7EAE4A|nr:kinesin-like protein KIN-14K isoform X2 [Juglans microcarpa x Juglans regia]